MNKFEIKGLKKSFGTHDVLCGIDLDIKEGSSLVILGGSGSGKSVFIKLMIGLLTPDSGEILYNGQDLTQFSAQERDSMLKECGYLFQSGALFDSLTIKENIIFFARKLYDLDEVGFTELAISKLDMVGLSDRVMDLFPAELSGGMQKRVALARAICTEPKVIFFDEPTTGLDPIMSNVINDLIVKIREELNATTITITHDIHSARVIGQDVAFLNKGQFSWRGKINELDKAQDETLRKFLAGVA